MTMVTSRSYDQYCGLARAMDVVGERWTLLIVRDLASGPRRFTDLRASLAGCSSSMLTDRLRQLESGGVIAKRRLPPPAASDVYELTESGRELWTAVFPLITWGVRHALGPLRPEDTFEASWPLQILQAFAGSVISPDVNAIVQFHLDGSDAYLTMRGGLLEVHAGISVTEPTTVITGKIDDLVPLALGTLDPTEAIASGRIEVSGDPVPLQSLIAMLPAVTDAISGT